MLEGITVLFMLTARSGISGPWREVLTWSRAESVQMGNDCPGWRHLTKENGPLLTASNGGRYGVYHH